MKIITIVGARPQFIKAAAVSREITNHPEIFEKIVHTGQHFDANMSDIFFDEMQIPKPDYNLNINGLNHGAMTGQMMEKIEDVLLVENPDWVLVYGDTNSTIAGALAARKLHINVAHVEAGLRSFNMRMPEEINRILTDRISNILFCPTDAAIDNLMNEGYKNMDIKILKTGDVMQDAAIFYKTMAKAPSLSLSENFILATIHRAENTDDPTRLKSIFEAFNQISAEVQLVLPLHPRTKKIIQSTDILLSDNLKIIDPVGYLEMVYLLKNCMLVMTDSGGLQKEAFFFGKPCITLRDETEWVELVQNGFNRTAGADSQKILDYFHNQKYNLDFNLNLYGKGMASSLIINALKQYQN